MSKHSDQMPEAGRGRGSGVLADVPKQAVENIRRALGKLVSRTNVYEIALGSHQDVPAIPDNALLFIPCSADTPRGLLEVAVPEGSFRDALSIPVDVYPAGIPHAESGGGGVDLAAVVTVIGADAALGAAATRSHAVDLAGSDIRSYDVPAGHWTTPQPPSRAVDVEFHPAGAYSVDLGRDKKPAVGKLPVDQLSVNVCTRSAFVDALRPMRLSIRSSVQRAYAAPLVRRSSIDRRSGPNVREREKLAAAAKTDVDSVILIGLFRNIPVTAVSRLAVEEEDAVLSVWLRPESAKAGAPRLVSLLIGRDKNTGKTIQTVA